MTALEQVTAEIILLHEQIEAWFRGDASPDAIDALVACFEDAFQMVTTRGDLLDRASVRDLFARLRGARPGVAITIDHVAMKVEQADGWLATYREVQVMPDGTSNRRYSVAWLRRAGEGRPSWSFLQETALP